MEQVALILTTPAYNRGERLHHAFASICQNLRTTDLFRVIWLIQDDGSNDGTSRYVDALYQNLPRELQSRFNILYEANDQNLGIILTRNALINRAVRIKNLNHELSFVMNLDSDDTIQPEFMKTFERILTYLPPESVVGYVFPDTHIYEDRIVNCACQFGDGKDEVIEADIAYFFNKYNDCGDESMDKGYAIKLSKLFTNFYPPLFEGEKWYSDYLPFLIHFSAEDKMGYVNQPFTVVDQRRKDHHSHGWLDSTFNKEYAEGKCFELSLFLTKYGHLCIKYPDVFRQYQEKLRSLIWYMDGKESRNHYLETIPIEVLKTLGVEECKEAVSHIKTIDDLRILPCGQI